MGRQKGEGARSKSRPSSSSLAASLLPAGAATIGFGGYVGNSRLDSTLPIENVSVSPKLDVDGEVAQHLKRLGRKDPTTKLKALASLSEIFKEKSKEDIIQIIPQWAFEYKRLLQDYNREVRRAAHDTMTNLVITAGRGLAPFLKTLMGPWWVSQFDPVSEVSQAARKSLQDAFPVQERRLDALILCTNEVLLYIEENLKLTPQSMSDKATPQDELEEMHQRIISTSLLALATLIDILFGMQIQKLDFENVTSEPKNASKARETVVSSAEKIFSAHTYFLEFLKSQAPAVRSASYSVLGSFIKHIPDAFNEGNKKALSTAILGAFQEKDPTCHPSMWDTTLLFSRRFPDCWSISNIQKTALSRFWVFLRKGCYGSQQVSYPQLVLFLDTIPAKTIDGERFFLNFFQNLWEGRNPSHSSAADRLSFFKALEECFVWGIHNASRYLTGTDPISSFQVNLISSILVNLLWRDYLLVVSPKLQDEALSGKSRGSLKEDMLSFEGRKLERLNTKYPLSYMQDLGKCIVEVLSDLSLMEHELLNTFCTVFQEECLSIIQQAEHLERPFDHVEQIVNFLLLLKQHAMQKGETWPLEFLALPLVTKAFPLIKSLDSPDAVKLLAVTISIFGPRKVVPQLSMCSEGHSINHLSKKDDDTSTSELFLQVFREIFVPWCLHGCNLSTGARLDLLLALLDDELFPEQWCSIITYATRLDEHHSFEVGSSGSDHFFVLAMLMEKVREEIDNRKIQAAVNHRQGSIPEHWHHKLLDSAAVSVARCNPPFLKSYSRFLRAILGGLTEDDRTFLVTKDSMILVFEELLKKFLPLLNDSPFHWTKYASSLLLCTASQDLVLVCESKADILELAKFSLEVLEGSFFCLRRFDQESELVPCISATIIIIDWEYRMASQVITEKGGVVSSNIIDGKLVENAKAFIESVHALRLKINSLLTKGLSIQNLRKLENILVQSIRSAIFETGIVNTDIIPSMCCQWMVEVLEFVGCDQNEEQSLLDQLLDEGKFWPFWIVSPLNDKTRSATPRIGIMSAEIQAPEHCQFVAFVNELISKLGFSRVIAGSLSESIIPSSSVETLDGMGSLRSYRRPWLAAEILCTWRWKGGCALGSFLPFLSEFAKRGTSSSEESLLDAIIDLLLNGALVCGARDEVCFFNVWPATDDEIESIQDPFLRGLISLLSTLLMKNNIWGRKKAAVLFDRLVGTLFIGTMVNRDCLKILPYVINVIIRPIRQASYVPDNTSRQDSLDSFDENQMIVDWLQRAVSLPPLTSWKPGQDFEEWVQVIISCYPLDAIGGISALNAASGTKINHTEKMLLLDLFRKQRADVDALAPVNQSPSVQMILSKLTAISVGYCWKEFNEDDWEFVLSQVRRSTDSAVMLMEEITENVDEIIVNKHPSDNLEDITRKLEQVVQIAEGSLVNIASDALFTFSMFCGIIENQKEEGPEVLEIVRMDKWGNVKDRILEGVLRLFFATGVAEAVAGSVYKDASAIVASSRLVHSRFWQLVASIVINSPENVRNTAVQSVGLWELSKGPISSLYAILFSSLPLSSLQLAAFVILSTEPVSHLSFIKEDTACLIEDNIANQEFDQSHPLDSSSEESVHFREEISCMIEKSPSEIIEMDLVAHERVNVFIAWALLLSNLHSLPPASPTKQRMIQCVQDSANSKILDCLFQHIPLKAATHSLKKKDRGLPVEVSQVATAAKCSISTGSLMFSVESLWPVGIEKMASLAGAIYGLMLHALPAYVRDWFTSIRDRSTSIAIESFTKTWCSPPLLADELSQIKKASVADENFSISVSKSVYEVVATYKKEETGMDLVITFPVSYPLRPVDVDCTRSLGISDLKQRKWLMSMLAFVRSQNGALAEAIRTWKSNFDKEFLGVEECPICYSIIHTSNNSLPRLACKTCKHKFHKACLFKWFHTSHKSTCPLCQSPF